MSHHSVCTSLLLLATLKISTAVSLKIRLYNVIKSEAKQNVRSGANSAHNHVKNVARVSFPSLLKVSNFVDLTEEWELMKCLFYHICYTQAVTLSSTTRDEYKCLNRKNKSCSEKHRTQHELQVF